MKNRLIISFAILCIGSGATWIISEQFRNPEVVLAELYEGNKTPCMNYWTTVPGFADTISIQAKAMKLYDEGNYSLALEAFQKYEPTEEDEAFYNMYLGICYLRSDFANLAIAHLQEANQLFKKYEMIQMSKWYLSLAHLKAGQQNEAVDLLSQLVEANAPQKYKAEDILKKIDISNNPIKGLFLAFKD